MSSELHTKIGKGEETVGVVETLLVFPVTAFYFAVVAGRIRTDEFVPDAWFSGGSFKQGG